MENSFSGGSGNWSGTQQTRGRQPAQRDYSISAYGNLGQRQRQPQSYMQGRSSQPPQYQQQSFQRQPLPQQQSFQKQPVQQYRPPQQQQYSQPQYQHRIQEGSYPDRPQQYMQPRFEGVMRPMVMADERHNADGSPRFPILGNRYDGQSNMPKPWIPQVYQPKPLEVPPLRNMMMEGRFGGDTVRRGGPMEDPYYGSNRIALDPNDPSNWQYAQ